MYNKIKAKNSVEQKRNIIIVKLITIKIKHTMVYPGLLDKIK